VPDEIKFIPGLMATIASDHLGAPAQYGQDPRVVR
jgi:hypothetical protein